MRIVLFASAAAVSLVLAGAALAQTTLPEPVPTPPPVQTPPTTPDATLEGQVGTTVQPAPPQAEADAQADAEAQAAVPPDEAADNAEAMAATPAAPAADAATVPAVATPETASAMCQPRVTSVHFGARGSALSQENRNAIEYAVDAASVCTVQSVVIADSAEGRTSARRAEAVRTTLVRQGVPRERISVDSAANAEGAGTGQLDVRMSFTGLSNAGAATATDEAEPTPAPPEY